MFVAYHIILDWGPRGMWFSNCSGEVNSTVCDYVIQVTWKVTDTTMEHYLGKGLLGWLDGGLAPPHSRMSSINRVGLNNGTFENLLRTPEHEKT